MFNALPRPSKDIPDSEKGKQYYIDHAYWLLGLFYNADFQVQRQIIAENEAFRAGDIDEGYYQYLTNPGGTRDQTVAALFENYPLMKPIMDAYEGEFLMNELQYSVEVVNQEAYLAKEEKKMAVLAEKLLKPIVKDIQRQTGIKVYQEEMEHLFPDDLEAIKHLDFRENFEDTALNIIRYNELQYNYVDLFKKGLSDYLNSNTCIYKVVNMNGDPVPQKIPVRNCIVVPKEGDDLVENSEAYAIVTMKSVSEILTRWRDKLSDEEIRLLNLMETTSVENYQQMGTIWMDVAVGGITDFYDGIGTKNCKIIVAECSWRDQRGIHAKTSKNDYDITSPFIKTLSPENYYDDDKFDDVKRKKYKTVPYEDIKECVLIGHMIAVNDGRQENQRQRSSYGAGAKKMDLTGVFNSAKSAPATILKPLHRMYCAVWFHIDRILAQMGGKAIEVWSHHRPDNMTDEEWYFKAKNGGFIIKELKEEDQELGDSQTFKGTYDFGLSPQFGTLVNFLFQIESTARGLVGQNPARTGELSGNEGLGITKLNLQQSIITTLPIFHDMRRVIDSTLNCVLDKARKIYKTGDHRFWLGEKEKLIIEITSDFFAHEYGLFVKNNQKEKVKLARIQELSMKAMSSGGADYFDSLLEITNAETSIEALGLARKGFEALRAANRLMQEQQNAAQQQLAGVMAEKNQLDKQKMQIDYKKATDVANINKEAKLQDTQLKLEHDMNKDEVSKSFDNERFQTEKLLEMVNSDSGTD